MYATTNVLFHPIRLKGKPLLWGHRNTTTRDFTGFYHWHQICEMLFVHEGKGTIIVNSKAYEIRRGLLFFFQPFQLHKVYANVSEETPYVRSTVHFDPYAFQELLRPYVSRHSLFLKLWKGSEGLSMVDMGSAVDYVERVFELYDHTVTSEPSGYEEDTQLMMLQMMNGISRALQGKPELINQEAVRPMSHTEAIMQWVEEHYTEDVQLEDIAEALHLSKFYVSRLFLSETGAGIPQYLTARRMKQACRLLENTSLPVERIGEQIGIPNPSYFIRIFKKAMGITPLQYRKKLS